VPARALAVEAALLGKPLNEASVDAAVALLDITPLDDIRSTADYRNAVARRILRAELIGL
jgi:xanthine dehydrogenase small subunit